jgi:hypothetical protein
MITNAQLIELVNAHPEGIITSEVARIFNARQDSIASRLSKLYNYGLISRDHATVKYNHARWMPLPNGPQLSPQTSAALVALAQPEPEQPSSPKVAGMLERRGYVRRTGIGHRSLTLTELGRNVMVAVLQATP